MKADTGKITTKIALFLSLACAVHCMVMPLLLVSLPFLGDSFLHNPFLEWILLGTLIVMGQFSMNHYRKKHHAHTLPGKVFTAGAIICLAALLVSTHHEWMTIIGSVTIAISHGMNLRFKKLAA